MRLLSRLPKLVIKTAPHDPFESEDRPRIAAVDLDGTLAELKAGRLKNTPPRPKAAEAVRKLKAAGFYIIIWTARHDETDKEIGAWLDKHGIPFDAINENKYEPDPKRKIKADVYIDDKAVNADLDLDLDDVIDDAISKVLGDPYQPVDKHDGWDELKKLAKKAQLELEKLLGGLDFRTIRLENLELGELEAELRKPGGVVVYPPLKGRKRSKEKVEADYHGDWRKLLDVVRATVAVDDMGGIEKATKAMADSGAVLAKPMKDRFCKPQSDGFRALLAYYRLPCKMICEVQFSVKPMVVAVQRGWLLKDVVRAIKASMEEEGRDDYTPAESEAIRRARNESKHIFARAWAEVNGGKEEKTFAPLVLKSRLPVRKAAGTAPEGATPQDVAPEYVAPFAKVEEEKKPRYTMGQTTRLDDLEDPRKVGTLVGLTAWIAEGKGWVVDAVGKVVDFINSADPAKVRQFLAFTAEIKSSGDAVQKSKKKDDKPPSCPVCGAAAKQTDDGWKCGSPPCEWAWESGESKEKDWITIGGGPARHGGRDEQHHGGTPVFVDQSGNISAGAAPFRGRNISDVAGGDNRGGQQQPKPAQPKPGQPKPQRPGGAGVGAEDASTGRRVAEPSGQPSDQGASSKRGDAGQPTGAKAAQRVPASVEEVEKRLDRYADFFRSKGQEQAAGWMELLKSHVGAVGTDAALASLGEEVRGTKPQRAEGGTAQYEGGWDSMGDFAESYLNRHGIVPVFQLPGSRPTGESPLISSASPAQEVRETTHDPYMDGDFTPADPTLRDKLAEAKHLPGLEASEDINVIMGKPITHLTSDVTKKLDERYGQGKWIIKAFGEDAASGYGVFFPQRIAQITQQARDTIWNAGVELAKYGFKLARDKDGQRVAGLVHSNGDWYQFGTPKYDRTIQGEARQWADKAAQSAENEVGAQLPGGGKDFMAQPAFAAVGVSDADRAAGKLIAPGEGRVHIVTRNGKAELVPHSTWIKGEWLPVVFDDDNTKAMAKAAVDAINALPDSEKQGQIYAPDILKAAEGYRVVEANPANETGSSGYLGDSPFIIDSYVSHIMGREPAHVRFIRNVLSRRGATKSLARPRNVLAMITKGGAVWVGSKPSLEEKRWVTIGGGSGSEEPGHEGEDHHGGTRVNIGEGGKVTQGPKPLVGHDVDHLPKKPKPAATKPATNAKPKTPQDRFFWNPGELTPVVPNAASGVPGFDKALGDRYELYSPTTGSMMSFKEVGPDKINISDGRSARFLTRAAARQEYQHYLDRGWTMQKPYEPANIGGPSRTQYRALKSLLSVIKAGKFREEEHPRDEIGEFTEGGGSGKLKPVQLKPVKPNPKLRDDFGPMRSGETELSYRGRILNSPSILSRWKPPKVLYHVAPRAVVDSIMRNGLKVGSKRTSSLGEISGVYLTEDPGDLGKQGGDIGGGDVVTFAINTDGLNLRLDPEYFYYDASPTGAAAYVDAVNNGEEMWAAYSPQSIPANKIRMIGEGAHKSAKNLQFKSMLEDRVLDALSRASYGFMSLAQLGRQLGTTPDQLKQAINNLRRAGKVTVAQAEGRFGSNEEDRRWWWNEGSDTIGNAMLRR